MKKLLFGLALTTLFASCNNQIPEKVNSKTAQKIQIKGDAQGTYYAITYYDTLNRNLKTNIDSLLLSFDLSASNYVDSSIISKVNANIPIKLDDVFIGNFLLSQEISENTNGDYDITVRPLVELWGFGKKEPKKVKASEVNEILKFIGYKKVHLINNTIIKDDKRIQLDYNAIAQGYSVDVVARYLKTHGIENFLVDIGGEVYASGRKDDSSLWQVGIERPKDNEKYGEALTAIVKLKDRGMATSGNYRKFYIQDGVKYSHEIDPHTGYPAKQNLLSATVFAVDAAHADGYATAFMVMGFEKAKDYIAKHSEMDAFFIYTDSSGSYKYFYTQNLKKNLEMEQ